MTTLQEMHEKIMSSKEHEQMLRSVAPMCEYYGVNNFYYTTTTLSGFYSGFCTCTRWHEYFCENFSELGDSPFLRHPSVAKLGISLLKNTPDSALKQAIKIAWDKYHINFTLNIQLPIEKGFESFGFGLKTCYPKAEEHLLNELPLLKRFISFFRKENKKLIDLSRDHCVEIASLLGPRFYHEPPSTTTLQKRELFLRQLGLSSLLSLTPREIDVLKFLANGFPANYIAKQLHISCRTVENHIAAIKSKLECGSKVELINKAQEMVSIITHA